MMCTPGFSQAAMSRRVICSEDWVKCEWTEATQTSKPLSTSCGQSTEPSGPMFSSVPCSSRISG
ncbi:hypothetical protein D3C83_128130 [compost metagenome]